VLADLPDGKLQIRALATGEKTQASGRFFYSQHLAQRCFDRGESILCCKVSEDPELANAQSIAGGAMASVLCVLLRTPRRKLGVLHLDRSYFQKPFTQDDLQLADALAANVSAGIECAQLLRKQREFFYHTINILAQAVELRDTYTGGHTLRVTNYSVLLGHKMELPAQEMNLIRIGTPLHDVGKIGIDDAILRKPDRLTPEEFEIMKTHTTLGRDAIVAAENLIDAPSTFLRLAREIAHYHQEKWDGSGYPEGLKGEAIPLPARLMAVADVYDALISRRVYKPPFPHEKAVAIIQEGRGRHFDPDMVDAFLAIAGEFHAIAERFADSEEAVKAKARIG
jgi:response regulator RpfG family c-di-GMP phosphodiesterase